LQFGQACSYCAQLVAAVTKALKIGHILLIPKHTRQKSENPNLPPIGTFRTAAAARREQTPTHPAIRRHFHHQASPGTRPPLRSRTQSRAPPPIPTQPRQSHGPRPHARPRGAYSERRTTRATAL
jgi:hypothetical protein